MAIPSRVLLECLVPFLQQEPPAPQQQVSSEPPWVVVDTPDPGLGDRRLGDLQLVVLGDGTYVASYRLDGDRPLECTTLVARSRDRGVTWERGSEIDELRNASLVEHDDVLWLMGVRRRALDVWCSRDAGESWGSGPSHLRDLDSVEPASPALIHRGRVWRSFSRSLITTCEGAREHVLVASAALGTDLQDPKEWRWSSELPLDCVGSELRPLLLLAEPGREPALLLFAGKSGSLRAVAGVENSGWELRRVRDDPAWILPVHTWTSNLVSENVLGRSYVVVADATREAQRSERAPPRGSLTLQSAELLGDWTRTIRDPTWTTTVLLRDARQNPLDYWRAAVLVEGDDLAILLAFGEPWEPVNLPPAAHPRIAFLRVPKFRERTRESPPLWESKR